ncbi:MAG: hypothetical protein M3134_01825 [Actinomycetota bacterium]|nr:hypothetical protein [Actinomycetota bacterium]
MFESKRHARLYLVSFFFAHSTPLFVFPTFTNPSARNVWWLVLLMAVYGPLFGLGVMGVRYIPRGGRSIFSREKAVYSAAIADAGLEGRRWTIAFYAGRAALLLTLVTVALRLRGLSPP